MFETYTASQTYVPSLKPNFVLQNGLIIVWFDIFWNEIRFVTCWKCLTNHTKQQPRSRNMLILENRVFEQDHKELYFRFQNISIKITIQNKNISRTLLRTSYCEHHTGCIILLLMNTYLLWCNKDSSRVVGCWIQSETKSFHQHFIRKPYENMHKRTFYMHAHYNHPIIFKLPWKYCL